MKRRRLAHITSFLVWCKMMWKSAGLWLSHYSCECEYKLPATLCNCLSAHLIVFDKSAEKRQHHFYYRHITSLSIQFQLHPKHIYQISNQLALGVIVSFLLCFIIALQYVCHLETNNISGTGLIYKNVHFKFVCVLCSVCKHELKFKVWIWYVVHLHYCKQVVGWCDLSRIYSYSEKVSRTSCAKKIKNTLTWKWYCNEIRCY